LFIMVKTVRYTRDFGFYWFTQLGGRAGRDRLH